MGVMSPFFLRPWDQTLDGKERGTVYLNNSSRRQVGLALPGIH
jgi:hypothetical protein